MPQKTFGDFPDPRVGPRSVMVVVVVVVAGGGGGGCGGRGGDGAGGAGGASAVVSKRKVSTLMETKVLRANSFFDS